MKLEGRDESPEIVANERCSISALRMRNRLAYFSHGSALLGKRSSKARTQRAMPFKPAGIGAAPGQATAPIQRTHR